MSLNDSLKNIDTFVQQFIVKSVSTIVQSRLGTERTFTKCNPQGKDWFNLDIQDIKDIVEQTTKCLRLIQGQPANHTLSFVKKNWKVCCEISLRNSDGITLVLEYWIFSNVVLNTTAEEVPEAKLSQHVYQVLNRMSCMIKSLIVLTRSTPAYKLSSKGQSADSYVICYRIYQCDENFLPNNMDPVGQSGQFSPIKTLGTIKSLYNEVSISLVYRTSMNMNLEDSKFQPASAAADDNLCDKSNLLLPVKDDHFKKSVDDGGAANEKFDVTEIFKPLNPAFAAKHKDELDAFTSTPFSALLPTNDECSNSGDLKESEDRLKDKKSSPISIPTQISPKYASSKSPQVYSTSNDSFVFVELNAPFASDDREFGSFFHGPSPTFVNNGDDSSTDINELSLQLAELESNAPQIDSFVESICINESEELKFEA